jgi:hypothetical protein
MKTSQQFTALNSILFCLLILLGASCTTANREMRERSPNADATIKAKRGASLGIPGFEGLGSPTARRKQDFLANFGPPIARENAGNQMQFEILTYPVRGWDEKLLVYFYGEELLGFCRERARSTLDWTVRSRQRVEGGRVPLFQSWSKRSNLIFPRHSGEFTMACGLQVSASPSLDKLVRATALVGASLYLSPPPQFWSYIYRLLIGSQSQRSSHYAKSFIMPKFIFLRRNSAINRVLWSMGNYRSNPAWARAQCDVLILS